MSRSDQNLLYREIDVWRRGDGELIRYRCLQRLDTGQYCVQSSDFFQDPSDYEQRRQLDDQFVELLLEEAPEDRVSFYSSLEEAITRHEDDFADVIPSRN